MSETIGAVLPIALGVAVSPVPIIAVILMLLSPRAKAASMAFASGWMVGVAGVLALVAAVAGPAAGADESSSSTVVAVLKILLGAAALALAVTQWRGRPRGGETPRMPQWMQGVRTMTAVKAGGLGFVLAAVNPKNLTLCVTAGLTIGSAGLSGTESVVAGAVFVGLASSSVAAPVLAYLVMPRRVQRPLDDLRDWLTVHNAAIMTVLLLVLGVTIIGKGIADF